MINTIREETFKKRHVYPKLEDWKVNSPYAFSISPRHIPMTSFSENYLHQMQTIHQILNLDFIAYDLRPELSTDSTALHWHGTFSFKNQRNIASFYFHIIPRLKEFATFTIEPIFDYQWTLYCRKQRHYLKPYIQNLCKLPYHFHSKLSHPALMTNPLDH